MILKSHLYAIAEGMTPFGKVLCTNNVYSRRGAPMCAPKLDFHGHGFPQFQICPLLSYAMEKGFRGEDSSQEPLPIKVNVDFQAE